MRKLAFLIGAQTYGLTGVGNDLDTMAGLLVRGGFTVVRCEGPQATRSGILDGLQRLIRDAHGLEAVVIYYSGHGGLATAPLELVTDHRNALPPLQFIVPTDYGESAPSDFRGISAPELSVLLARLTNETPNVTVILDTCHSAHLAREEGLRAKALPGVTYVNVAEHLSRLRRQGLDTTERHVLGNQDAVRIVACGRRESAYEYTNVAGQRIGVLTESIALAVAEAREQPVSWAALMPGIRRRVQSLVPFQRPEAEGPSLRLLFQPVMSYSSMPSAELVQRPLGAAIILEWGRVIRGRPYPLPLAGATLHSDERVYLRVCNEGRAMVHVSLLYSDFSWRVSLITSLDPSGIALGPGEEHTVGSDELDGRLEGIALRPSPGADREDAPPAMFAVLVSSAPHDVTLLQRYGVRGGEEARPESTSGRRFRDIEVSAADPSQCDIHRLTFRIIR